MSITFHWTKQYYVFLSFFLAAGNKILLSINRSAERRVGKEGRLQGMVEH